LWHKNHRRLSYKRPRSESTSLNFWMMFDLFCCGTGGQKLKVAKLEGEKAWGIEENQIDLPEVREALDLHFPGALPGPEVHERLANVLGEYGIKPTNTILGTSVCSDEINTVNGTLVDTMKKHWGTNFPLGGIGGAPYVGKTGFFAFSHHVPDDGNVIVLYGPHVGITASGEVGKCLRNGQTKESTACGACVAAYQQSLAGNVGPDMALDMQQSWLRGKVGPCVHRIKSAGNPMAELAKVSYEAVAETVTAIANTDFGSGYLVLVGGIQLNMPKGYPDYFLPCSFTIQKKGQSPEDLLGSLRDDDSKFGA
jgi:hypothetical protein